MFSKSVKKAKKRFGSKRVETGRKILVGSGRVEFFLGRVESGRKFLGRVGSRSKLLGRVGSRSKFLGRVGSGSKKFYSTCFDPGRMPTLVLLDNFSCHPSW